MANKREAQTIIVRKTPRGLQPVSGFDAELLMGKALGTEFRLTSLTKRSLPQHRTYWKALSVVCRSTNKWPTPEHLHDALKRACGYITINVMLTGEEFVTTDSTAFDAMNAEQFGEYFNRAMEQLADAIGYDPLHFLDDAA
ncbi:hypothetical protein [Phyllobacterium ifriqiyense]|uniref:hypothetical protein n=1 Tax=Phyllobacterium ifriqiyense TaxID=314238 RepID=UPI00339A808A